MDKDIKIRKASENDVDTIFLIEQQGKGDWKKDFFYNELKNSFADVLVAEIGTEIAGFAVLWHAADELQLNDIAVGLSYRRQGVAGALLDFIINSEDTVRPKRIVLEVREKNSGAIAFYTSHDFKITGNRADYYGDDNAVLMEKAIP